MPLSYDTICSPAFQVLRSLLGIVSMQRDHIRKAANVQKVPVRERPNTKTSMFVEECMDVEALSIAKVVVGFDMIRPRNWGLSNLVI